MLIYFVLESEEISYIVLLDDWEILRDNLTILEKKLGGGQFGIVKQGLFSKDKNESEIVAVKMLKGMGFYSFFKISVRILKRTIVNIS